MPIYLGKKLKQNRIVYYYQYIAIGLTNKRSRRYYWRNKEEEQKSRQAVEKFASMRRRRWIKIVPFKLKKWIGKLMKLDVTATKYPKPKPTEVYKPIEELDCTIDFSIYE